MKEDICDIDDIKILVDKFYERAGKDVLLGPIFSRLRSADLDKQALYKYWTGELLMAEAGSRQPFPRHIELMFSRQHFIRWLELFLETIDSLYSGARADRAKVMVIRKSEEFQSRLEIGGF